MGRRRDGKKVATWRQRMQRWQKSGLSIARFCRRERVSEASFYYWRKRLNDDGKPEPASLFVPLSITHRAITQPIEIQLPNQSIVRLPRDCDQQLLCRLVDVVGRIDGNGLEQTQEEESC